MRIYKGVLKIDISMPIEEIIKLHAFIVANIKKIEVISAKKSDEKVKTSALLQLLISSKKSYPEVLIPLVSQNECRVEPFGKVYLKE